jgi:hypothetical protein
MAFSIQQFLIARAVGENVNPDQQSVNRIALVTSMMNVGLAQSAILAMALAQNQAPPPAPAGRPPGPHGGQAAVQGRPRVPRAKRKGKKPVP